MAVLKVFCFYWVRRGPLRESPLWRVKLNYGRVEPLPQALGAERGVSAAKRFFRRVMRAAHRRLPFTIGTDKHASYPEAFAASVSEKVPPFDCKLRRVKYLNNVIERDHRAIRRGWRAMRCFRSSHAAERTIGGVESMHMMRKGQVKRLDGRDAAGQAEFVASLFGVAAMAREYGLSGGARLDRSAFRRWHPTRR